MPYETTLEPRGAYKRFWGFVTAAEFIESARELQSTPHFDRMRYSINDFLAVTDFDVTKISVEEMAALNLGAMHSNPGIRLAILTTDARITALVYHFASPQLESYPTRIFATLEEARAWIAQDRP